MTLSARIGEVRTVVSRDLEQVKDLLDRDPVASCFVSSRIAVGGTDPWRLGGELLGYFDEGHLTSMLYIGANLAPVGTTATTRAAFADRLRRAPRRCSSFVGPADEVLDLWRLLEPAWGAAREVRTHQPLMALDHDPQGPWDERVRPATLADLDELLPACIDMFTAEVGVSPVARGSEQAYRARIAEMIEGGRSFVLVSDGRLLFKAEVGAVGSDVCQVQGVWIAHEFRGRGLAAPCMAAVTRLARATLAPVVSLYVNDFNTPARKAYLSAGFVEVGAFATVLF